MKTRCATRAPKNFSSAAALMLSIKEKYYRPTRTFPPKKIFPHYFYTIRFILHALTLLNAEDHHDDDDDSLIFKSIYF